MAGGSQIHGLEPGKILLIQMTWAEIVLHFVSAKVAMPTMELSASFPAQHLCYLETQPKSSDVTDKD